MARLHTYAQHFLKNPRIVAELIGHASIRKNDIVYDLGAGSGIISSVLANRCKQVVAVENEPQAAAKLRRNLGAVENIHIIEGDVLSLPIPTGQYTIFSNIPFNLSAPIVRKFSEADNPPRAMYLIVQRQFARKLVPGNDHFTSQLAAQLGPRFVARIRKPLKKTDFTPPPAVDTVLLELKLRKEPHLQADQMHRYREFVGRAFSEQRFFAQTPRGEAGIDPNKRPSELTNEQWVKLFQNNRYSSR